jgi:multidrug efflux pump subunit AcrA (membrane-fusion protein)
MAARKIAGGAKRNAGPPKSRCEPSTVGRRSAWPTLLRFRRMLISSCFALLATAAVAVAGEPPQGPRTIEVPSMLLRLIEQRDVPARQAGVLAAVRVLEGQMVEEGAAIAEIDDAEARIAEERSRIEAEIAKVNAGNDVSVRAAKKSVEVASAELRRSSDSNERYRKSVSESEMDRLRLVVEKGRLEIEQAQHELKIAGFTQQVKENEHRAAQEKVKQHKITSPVAGLVVSVARRSGEWVKPGEVVVRIVRLDRLRAEGFLKTEQWNEKLQGRPVRLSIDLPGAPGTVFPGKVLFVDPEIDPVNAQVRIWAEVENRQLRLHPGMRAQMTIEAQP